MYCFDTTMRCLRRVDRTELRRARLDQGKPSQDLE